MFREMKKLWYSQTSWDQWGPVFFFGDGDNSYRLRLAWNPILLLESYYNRNGGTGFMGVYKSISEWHDLSIISKENIKAITKAKKQCKEFFDAVLELQQMKKSLLVIYKE